jgi:plasmid stabilization system protein ParE
MRVVFSPEAREEFEEAERYYERQIPGLGARFRTEIRSALPRIRAWPLSCPCERGDIRRLTMSRFPYKLLYSVEADHSGTAVECSYLLMVAAPAVHTTSSCEPVPPEQPIAPIILPPSTSGMPPREAMMSSRVSRYS